MADSAYTPLDTDVTTTAPNSIGNDYSYAPIATPYQPNNGVETPVLASEQDAIPLTPEEEILKAQQLQEEQVELERQNQASERIPDPTQLLVPKETPTQTKQQQNEQALKIKQQEMNPYTEKSRQNAMVVKALHNEEENKLVNKHGGRLNDYMNDTSSIYSAEEQRELYTQYINKESDYLDAQIGQSASDKVTDFGTSILKGGLQLANIVPLLFSVATGGKVGNDTMAWIGKQVGELNESQSIALQEQRKRVFETVDKEYVANTLKAMQDASEGDGAQIANSFFKETGVAIGAVLNNPLMILDLLGEEIPSLVTGGFLAKGAANMVLKSQAKTAAKSVAATKLAQQAGSKRAAAAAQGRVSETAAIATSALEEGSSVASEATLEVLKMDFKDLAENSTDYNEYLKTMTKEEARKAVAHDVTMGTLASGVLLSALVTKFTGAGKLEANLFQRGLPESGALEKGIRKLVDPVSKAIGKGVSKIPKIGKGAALVGGLPKAIIDNSRAVGGIVKEGLEETVQGTLTQGAANLIVAEQANKTKDFREGLGLEAGLGGVVGGTIGGAIGAKDDLAKLSKKTKTFEQKIKEADYEAKYGVHVADEAGSDAAAEAGQSAINNTQEILISEVERSSEDGSDIFDPTQVDDETLDTMSKSLEQLTGAKQINTRAIKHKDALKVLSNQVDAEIARRLDEKAAVDEGSKEAATEAPTYSSELNKQIAEANAKDPDDPTKLDKDYVANITHTEGAQDLIVPANLSEGQVTKVAEAAEEIIANKDGFYTKEEVKGAEAFIAKVPARQLEIKQAKTTTKEAKEKTTNIANELATRIAKGENVTQADVAAAVSGAVTGSAIKDPAAAKNVLNQFSSNISDNSQAAADKDGGTTFANTESEKAEARKGNEKLAVAASNAGSVETKGVHNPHGTDSLEVVHQDTIDAIRVNINEFIKYVTSGNQAGVQQVITNMNDYLDVKRKNLKKAGNTDKYKAFVKAEVEYLEAVKDFVYRNTALASNLDENALEMDLGTQPVKRDLHIGGTIVQNLLGQGTDTTYELNKAGLSAVFKRLIKKNKDGHTLLSQMKAVKRAELTEEEKEWLAESQKTGKLQSDTKDGAIKESIYKKLEDAINESEDTDDTNMAQQIRGFDEEAFDEIYKKHHLTDTTAVIPQTDAELSAKLTKAFVKQEMPPEGTEISLDDYERLRETVDNIEGTDYKTDIVFTEFTTDSVKRIELAKLQKYINKYVNSDGSEGLAIVPTSKKSHPVSATPRYRANKGILAKASSAMRKMFRTTKGKLANRVTHLLDTLAGTGIASKHMHNGLNPEQIKGIRQIAKLLGTYSTQYADRYSKILTSTDQYDKVAAAEFLLEVGKKDDNGMPENPLLDMLFSKKDGKLTAIDISDLVDNVFLSGVTFGLTDGSNSNQEGLLKSVIQTLNLDEKTAQLPNNSPFPLSGMTKTLMIRNLGVNLMKTLGLELDDDTESLVDKDLYDKLVLDLGNFSLNAMEAAGLITTSQYKLIPSAKTSKTGKPASFKVEDMKGKTKKKTDIVYDMVSFRTPAMGDIKELTKMPSNPEAGGAAITNHLKAITHIDKDGAQVHTSWEDADHRHNNKILEDFHKKAIDDNAKEYQKPDMNMVNYLLDMYKNNTDLFFSMLGLPRDENVLPIMRSAHDTNKATLMDMVAVLERIQSNPDLYAEIFHNTNVGRNFRLTQSSGFSPQANKLARAVLGGFDVTIDPTDSKNIGTGKANTVSQLQAYKIAIMRMMDEDKLSMQDTIEAFDKLFNPGGDYYDVIDLVRRKMGKSSPTTVDIEDVDWGSTEADVHASVIDPENNFENTQQTSNNIEDVDNWIASVKSNPLVDQAIFPSTFDDFDYKTHELKLAESEHSTVPKNKVLRVISGGVKTKDGKITKAHVVLSLGPKLDDGNNVIIPPTVTSLTVTKGATSTKPLTETELLRINEVVKKGKLKAESLSALISLVNYTPDKPFKATIFREDDGIANGISMSMFTYGILPDGSLPTEEQVALYKELSSRVGVSLGGTPDIEVLRRMVSDANKNKEAGTDDEKMNDMYVYFSEEVTDGIRTFGTVVDDEIVDNKSPTILKTPANIKSADALIKQIENIKTAFFDADKLEKMMRDMVKEPLMRYVYGAGEDALLENIQGNIAKALIEDVTVEYNKFLELKGTTGHGIGLKNLLLYTEKMNVALKDLASIGVDSNNQLTTKTVLPDYVYIKVDKKTNEIIFQSVKTIPKVTAHKGQKKGKGRRYIKKRTARREFVKHTDLEALGELAFTMAPGVNLFVGESIVNIIDKNFGATKTNASNFNDSVTLMGQMYATYYNRLVNRYENEVSDAFPNGKQYLTQQNWLDINKKMDEAFPGIRTAISKTDTWKSTYNPIKSEKVAGSTKHTSRALNGKSSRIGRSNIGLETEVAEKHTTGSPYSIHQLDASIIIDALQEDKTIIQVYDGLIQSPIKFDATQASNEAYMKYVLGEHSPINAILDTLAHAKTTIQSELHNIKGEITETTYQELSGKKLGVAYGKGEIIEATEDEKLEGKTDQRREYSADQMLDSVRLSADLLNLHREKIRESVNFINQYHNASGGASYDAAANSDELIAQAIKYLTDATENSKRNNIGELQDYTPRKGRSETVKSGIAHPRNKTNKKQRQSNLRARVARENAAKVGVTKPPEYSFEFTSFLHDMLLELTNISDGDKDSDTKDALIAEYYADFFNNSEHDLTSKEYEYANEAVIVHMEELSLGINTQRTVEAEARRAKEAAEKAAREGKPPPVTPNEEEGKGTDKEAEEAENREGEAGQDEERTETLEEKAARELEEAEKAARQKAEDAAYDAENDGNVFPNAPIEDTEGDVSLLVANHELNQRSALETFDSLLSDRPSETSDSPEHTSHLKSLIKSLASTYSYLGRAISLEINKRLDSGENTGTATVGSVSTDITLNLRTTAGAGVISMSAQEVLAHEYVHPLWNWGLTDAAVMAEARRLYALVNENPRASYTMFLDPTDPNPSPEDVKMAKARFNHAFGASKKGLEEFLTYAMTNKQFRDAIGTVINTPPSAPTGFWGRLNQLFDRVIGLLNKSTRDYASSKPNVQGAVDELFIRINDAMNQPKKQSGLLTKFVNKIGKGADYVDGAFKKAMVDTLNKVTGEDAELGDKSITEYMAPTMDAVRSHINTLNGFVSHEVRDIFTQLAGNPEDASEGGRILSIGTANVDAVANRIKAALGETINKLFKRQPNTAEKSALNEFIGKADVSALMDNLQLDENELAKILSNQSEIDEHKASVEEYLHSKLVSPTINVLLGFSNAMAEHIMNDNNKEGSFLHNATGIVNFTETVVGKLPSADKARVIRAVDTYVSLLSIEKMSKEAKAKAHSLLTSEDTKEGVKGMITAHSAVKELARTGVFADRQYNMKKGHVVDLTNRNKDLVIDSLGAEQRQKDKGYILKEKVEIESGIFGNTSTWVGIYVRPYGGDRAKSNSAFKSTSVHKYGEGIQDLMSMSGAAGPNDALANRARVKVLNNNLELQAKAFQHGRPMNSRFVTDMIPVPTVDGKFKEYRVSIVTEAFKMKHLNMKQDLSYSLATAASRMTYKIEAPIHNEKVTDSLIATYKKDYEENPDNFYVLSPQSYNPVFRDAYDTIPTITRTRLAKAFDGKNIYIKKNQYTAIFGFRQWSVADMETNTVPEATLHKEILRLVHNVLVPVLANRYALTVEGLTQEYVGELAKTIVVKTGVVAMANAFSNMGLMSLYGINPVKTAIYAAEGLKYGLAYTKLETEQSKFGAELIVAKRARPANPVRVRVLAAKISSIQAQLERSPVHSMAQSGLLSTIVLDSKNDRSKEFTTRGIVREKADKYVFNNIPEAAGDIIKELLVMEDSSIYSAMQQATVMSDFMFKYAMHKHHLEAGMPAKKSLDKINYLFLNYESPSAKPIDYLETLGIVMFSKYYIRYQRIVMDAFAEAPAKFIVQATLHATLLGTASIFDSSIFFGSSPLSLVHNPYMTAGTFGDIFPIKLLREILAMGEPVPG